MQWFELIQFSQHVRNEVLVMGQVSFEFMAMRFGSFHCRVGWEGFWGNKKKVGPMFGAHLGPIWGPCCLGPIWAHLGPIFYLFGAHWGPFWAHFILGPFGPIGPSLLSPLGGLLVIVVVTLWTRLDTISRGQAASGHRHT